MHQKSQEIRGIFNQKQDNHIRIFQEISDVISVYKGPQIDSSIDYKNLHKKTIGSANLFSFNLSSDNSLIEYKFFRSGELVLRITITIQDLLRIEWLDEKSETLVAFIEMLFITLEKNQHSQISTSIFTKSEASAVVKENQDAPFQYSVSCENKYQFEEHFITVMNKSCKLLTQNKSPEFGIEDRKREHRQHTHEDFTRIEKVSDSGFSIYYELYSYDTGHYQQPYGGHLIFKLFEKTSAVFEAEASAERIHIILQPLYTRHQNELIALLIESFQKR